MNQEPVPKTQGARVKKILLVLVAAGAVIWYIAQRSEGTAPPAGPPVPAVSQSTVARSPSPGGISNEMSANTNSAARPAPSQASESQDEQVERYPMLDSPDEVAPQQEFHIQVSLTEQQIGPDLKFTDGQTTADGKLVFSLPANQDNSWKLEVALMAPGLEFIRGTQPDGSIILPRKGNATSVTFWARPGPKAIEKGVVHLTATFNYNGTYLARIGRDIQIKGVTPALASEPPVMRRTVKLSGAVEDTPAEFNHAPVPADLTVLIKGEGIEVLSPYLGSETGVIPESTGFADWLAQHSPGNAGRGSQMMEPIKRRESAEGFGNDLYDNYAPSLFKKAFWMLVDARGEKFRTIQIYTDKMEIPWELMRPVRENKKDRLPFLGLSYSVARWHMTDGLRERPPFTQTMRKMFVIAPHYTGARALDAEATETQALAQMAGYSAVNGNMNGLRTLFQNSPQGIVHFAGHGELNAKSDYEILLEDGELDTTAWKGMAQDDPSSHTFYFFNACDVGQARRSGNFVDGWGPAVLGKGASGYIGALYPVDDQIAAQFSIHFYKLLQQQMQVGPADVGEILERTRRDVYESTKNPTALAYVLYGDTNLEFRR
jgi:hypothetical protein